MNITKYSISKSLGLLLFCFTLLHTPDACAQQVPHKSVKSIQQRLSNSTGKDVLIISHRGDWRNAPENSLQAIRNCITMGVDIVEIDIQKTKDGQLVLMHDKTLDRTTTGKGNVSTWTLDSLKTLFLRDGIGHATAHKIPTLEEAMLTAKGYIMVNLDKCYDYFPQAYSILEKTKTVDHVILKGSNKTVETVKRDLAIYLDKIYFMPIINLDQPGAEQVIHDFQQHLKPVAIEFTFSSDTSRVITKFNEIKQKGSRVWVNSLWSELCAGHDDERAVVDIEKNYGWILTKGTNMVQTDRPLLWIEYLIKHRSVR